jgi:hypothetical protein
LIPERNPVGLYLYSENVDGLAASLGDLVVHGQENKPWGMYEFAFSDPDAKLVRVGCQRPEADPPCTQSQTPFSQILRCYTLFSVLAYGSPLAKNPL